MAFEVPDLPYDYNALEPHIDEQTMRVHHDKHHQAYVDNANKALEGTEWADRPVEQVLGDIEILPFLEAIRQLGNDLPHQRPLRAVAIAAPGVNLGEALKHQAAGLEGKPAEVAAKLVKLAPNA